MNHIDFTGRVAIVTGAGGGLGREYALELARRGARVVVNDLGGSVRGEGFSDAAQAVVAEIIAAGGEAIADDGSVTDGAAMSAMADRALSVFGRIDVLICNAGILRDRSFAKLSLEDFDAVVETHLLGSARCAKAVWEIMRAAGYGRIVMTTSTAGLLGNFGQANYASAKLGIVGLANALRVEGRRSDIRVNVISPFAVTRMSEGLVPPEVAAAMNPRYVAPGVAYLASEDAPDGVILNAGAGLFSVVRIVDSPGIKLDRATFTAEDVRDRWAQISDPTGEASYADAHAHSLKLNARML